MCVILHRRNLLLKASFKIFYVYFFVMIFSNRFHVNLLPAVLELVLQPCIDSDQSAVFNIRDCFNNNWWYVDIVL